MNNHIKITPKTLRPEQDFFHMVGDKQIHANHTGRGWGRTYSVAWTIIEAMQRGLSVSYLCPDVCYAQELERALSTILSGIIEVSMSVRRCELSLGDYKVKFCYNPNKVEASGLLIIEDIYRITCSPSSLISLVSFLLENGDSLVYSTSIPPSRPYNHVYRYLNSSCDIQRHPSMDNKNSLCKDFIEKAKLSGLSDLIDPKF